MAKQTVKEVAKELDLSEPMIRYLAAKLRLGERIGARMLVFSEKDIEKIRKRKTSFGPEPKKKKKK
jgi:DNA-binding transcriptional MerR regulator